MSEPQPAEIFWPGEYLQDELAERGWGPERFAFMVGVPCATITNFINGYRPMTAELAKAVGEGTGTSPEMWMNLQRIWDQRAMQNFYEDDEPIGHIREILARPPDFVTGLREGD